MEKFNGIDLESAGKVAGNGFYYLMGDIARLHSAVISYAPDQQLIDILGGLAACYQLVPKGQQGLCQQPSLAGAEC